MKLLFGFFLRLAVGLLAAKITLRAVGSTGTAPLVGLSLLYVALAYGFACLKDPDRQSLGRQPGAQDCPAREESRP
jgi:hypothetical protein